MPRQQIPFAVPHPVPPLNLEEVKFWLMIMQEHAVFIKAGLPADDMERMNEAQSFFQGFGALRARADKVQSEKKFGELVADAQSLVRDFYHFKRRLLRRMLACKLGGNNFPLFLDHLAREAEYFLRLLDKMRHDRSPFVVVSTARENAFWVRLMDDHTRFIRQKFDPSERNLIKTIEGFSEDFDGLQLEGQDWVSMLGSGSGGNPPSYGRYLQDVRFAVLRLRDFKRAITEMIAECKLLGILPEMMAEHVRCEAEHFLMILSMIDKGLLKEDADCGQEEEIEEIEEIEEPIQCEPEPVMEECPVFLEEEPREKTPCVSETPEQPEIAPVLPTLNADKDIKDAGDDEEEEDEDEDDEEDLVVPPPPPSPKPPVTSKKYKWSGKWPRALGKIRD
ncbi:Hypothetical protein LUCI_0473 [Lucifera butyrica]|uniref:DUF2935 domain-containing protein n=1 Tax=Lucifera butyrica TaxID=1351585 RepID=A0A498QYK4_9FIRM|nr:DUF2935 domain-containing protein [Lucifera butyrica]VBB05266.1 Hypothetical protein LUCI_0473 [Lucifera butyrica]